MSVVNKPSVLAQPRLPSEALIENNDDNDSEEHITFIQELHLEPRHHHQQTMNTTNNTSSPTSILGRRPSNLLELKQQRLLAAADRKNRLITRIISIVGLLIILLCAIIVTLTLKMAPKIDELVRTKTGSHQLFHLMSRTSTPSTITMEFNNFTTNNSFITKSTFHTRQKLFI